MNHSIARIQYHRLSELYRKLKTRFDKAVRENRFKDFTKRKQLDIIKRLEKLKAKLGRLEQGLKVAGTAMALGFVVGIEKAQAQLPLSTGSEFRINTYTAGNQYFSSIAMDSDGDFVVAWQSNGQDEGSGAGVYAQRYDASGLAQGNEFLVNTTTANDQGSVSVAMDSDGDFVIAWGSNEQDGSGNGIYAQRYNASGVPQGSEFLVNTYTTNSQTNPSIAMDSNGDFVISWSSQGQDGSGKGIFAQRYNALGVPQGSEFQVNTYTTEYQVSPSAAMDSDGNFVITWISNGQDGSYSGVYAQRFNAMGVPQGSEFRVNTYTDSFQERQSVAMDSDGDFVITWQSTYGEDSYLGIYAQRYNAAGVPQGGEFLVNTYTDDYQYGPSIAMDSDGDFVITWVSYVQDGSEGGIYAQRYNAAGVPQGNEFLVNTQTADWQNYPTIATENNGDFVITWSGKNQDGDAYGVYAQQYIITHIPVVSDQSFSIDENSTIGTSIGTVVASDDDTGQTLSYAITAGNTNNVFAINNSTGEITIAGTLDYETASSYVLTVEVTDDGASPLSASATITININDITETGVADTFKNNHIRIYPNPSTGELHIESDIPSPEAYRLILCNTYGETVYESDYTQLLSLQHLPAGVYLLRLVNEQNIFVKQIVLK